MAIDTSKLTEKQAAWRMHLDRCRLRGVSLACYAEQENLSAHNRKRLSNPTYHPQTG